MGIEKVPVLDEHDQVKGNVAKSLDDYKDFERAEVVVWEAALHKSLGVRKKEQDKIKNQAGGEEAHEEKLKNDAKYRADWEGHADRIVIEEKAYDLAQEWIENKDNKK